MLPPGTVHQEEGCKSCRGGGLTPLLTLIPLRISFIVFMRSSLFFMFLTYKQKSQRSPKPDSNSPLEI